MDYIRKAIVKKPSPNYNQCISSDPERHSISLEKLNSQHKAYVRCLEELGLDLIILEADRHPDSCFVEDTVVIHKSRAVINNMGAASRRKEVGEIAKIIAEYKNIHHLEPPATLEGGDVIHLENKLISGITSKTNNEGIQELQRILKVDVKTIKDQSIVHLKSYLTSLTDDTFLSTQKYLNHPTLEEMTVIPVPEAEKHAANSLTINGVTLIPLNNDITKKNIQNLGLDVFELKLSEFRKCEGALTCLSILF